MKGRLDGKVAIVTGAGQGLGEALVHRLAAAGCAGVIAADVRFEAAERVSKDVTTAYNDCMCKAVDCDVTAVEQVAAMVAAALEVTGRLDIFVANAGILISEDLIDFPPEKWRAVLDVNLYGYFVCAQQAAKVMVAQRSGSIVQINSKSGKKGSFRNSAYAASKFGGIGLTQSMALDLAPYGVRVNAVCPGNLLNSPLWVDSLYEQYARKWGITEDEVRRKYVDQVPLGRGCEYDDVAGAVIFLASDESSYITGEAISVTGGQF